MSRNAWVATPRARGILMGVVGGGLAAAFVFGGATPGGSVPPCTITFNNTAGGSFFTAANWNDTVTPTTHRVPTTTDYACIPAATTGNVTFATGASATIVGLDAAGSGGFTLGSGTLTLTDPLNASAIEAASLNGGVVGGAGNLSINGVSTWTDTTMGGTGTTTVEAGASLTLGSASGGFLNRPLTNKGTVTIPAGKVLRTDSVSAVVTNVVGATIDLAGDGAKIGGWNSFGSVVNNGLIKRSAGVGTATIDLSLTTSLAKFSVQAGTGTVVLSRGGNLTGSMTLPVGATLSFEGGTFNLDAATMNGAGLVRLNAGSWQLTNTSSVGALLSLNGGVVGGAGNLSINGVSTWTDTTMNGTGTTTVNSSASLTLGSASGGFLNRPLTNKGTVTIPAGKVLRTDSVSAVVTNVVGATIDLAGDGAKIGGWNSFGSVVNNGLIKRSAGVGTATIDLSLTTSLAKFSVQAGTGTVVLSRGGNLTGSMTLPVGATLSFEGGTFNLDAATMNGAGLVRLNAGSWQLTNTSSVGALLSLNGGVVGGAGNLSINGVSTWTDTTMNGTGTTTVNSSASLTLGSASGGFLNRPLTNKGTVTIPAGKVLRTDSVSAVVTNVVGATIDLAGDGAKIRGWNSFGSVVNNGLIKRSAGVGTATIDLSLTTSLAKFSVQAGTGTVVLSRGGNLTGSMTLPVGATLSFEGGTFNLDAATMNGAGLVRLNAGSWQLTNTSSVGALLSLNGGVVGGAGNLSINGVSTWTDTTMNGTGTTTVNSSASLTLGSASGGFLNRPLTNKGTVTIPAGKVLRTDSVSAVVTNVVGATIDLAGDGATIRGWNSFGSVVNNGLIKRSAGVGTATIDIAVTNKGTAANGIEIDTGTLAVTRGLTNSGRLLIGYQALTVSGAAGMISTPTGIVEVNVSAVAHGTIAVTSANKLGGQLAITLAPAYIPPINTTVTLITTTGTQTGSFKTIGGQVITASTGWKISTAAKKVTIKVRPLSDVAASISAPPLATQTLPFSVTIGVTNNGPQAASGAAVVLTLPAGVTTSGPLPAGCTAPTVLTVRCVAGALAPAAFQNFSVSVVSNTAAFVTFRASATSANTDTVATAANNRQSASVTIV